MRQGLFVGAAILAILLMGCSPKIPPPDVAVQPPVRERPGAGPCGRFDDRHDPEEALNAHVLYRDLIRRDQFEEAFPLWQVAYQLAPAADGKRNTHFADGIRLYEYLFEGETDVARKEAYIDTIFGFYDQIEVCYGEAGYVAGRKAFDLYYKYKHRADEDQVFALFLKSLEVDGDNAQYFILNPFTDLMAKRFVAGKLEMAEAKRYEAIVRARLEKGLASGEDVEHWHIIQEYLPLRLESFEGVRGYYDCEYYFDKYWPTYLEDSTNCDVMAEVYGRLRWGNCDSTFHALLHLRDAGRRHCIVATTPSEAQLAYAALREGNYQEAVNRFLELAAQAEDREKKADHLMLVAKIYYGHLKDFPQARKYALEAASVRPRWGEPYLLIGRLYASSGPLCGPGRGWDSQMVVWPAIDKWNYAKEIDPAAAAEANKWINTYAQYMPSVEDIFQRTLKEGQSFRVGCWIQENTTIRPAPKM